MSDRDRHRTGEPHGHSPRVEKSRGTPSSEYQLNGAWLLHYGSAYSVICAANAEPTKEKVTRAAFEARRRHDQDLQDARDTFRMTQEANEILKQVELVGEGQEAPSFQRRRYPWWRRRRDR